MSVHVQSLVYSNPTRYEFDLERVRALPPSMLNPDTKAPISEGMK